MYLVVARSGSCLLILQDVPAILSCATSRTVPGSIPGGVTGNFFRGSFLQNHVSWGRLSLWKWVIGISPGVKAADAYGWRHTILVVPNVEMILDLNLPGTPRATLACRGTPLLYFILPTILIYRLLPFNFVLFLVQSLTIPDTPYINYIMS